MEQNVGIGIISAITCTIAFGSTYVPVRWFESGDGIYFQWLMAIGQMMIGVISLAATGWPPIHPLAMIGGALFAIGNSLTVFIMTGVGMAVGSLLWNTACCVSGWAVTRFGLFGSPQVVPYHNAMNIIGVIVVCIGGVFFATIKHHAMKVRPAPCQFEKPPIPIEQFDAEEPSTTSPYNRIVCLLLTLIVGFMYGNMLTPVNYLIAHSEELGLPNTVQAYFFAYSLGAFITSTIIFIGYSAVKRNRPFINPELSLPSLISGLLYGIAMCTFFLANHHLGQVVAYPMLSKSPGIITSLWATFLFKEIRGTCNLVSLVLGILVTIVGIAAIALSKIPF